MNSMAKYSNTCRRIDIAIASSSEKAIVGLKILTARTHAADSVSIFHWNQIPPSSSSSSNYMNCGSFLKYCFLCHKHLSPNKDVYMYRGDQGFCSEECRSRQIYIDDVTLLENKKKKKKKLLIIQRQSRRCDHHHHHHHVRLSQIPDIHVPN